MGSVLLLFWFKVPAVAWESCDRSSTMCEGFESSWAAVRKERREDQVGTTPRQATATATRRQGRGGIGRDMAARATIATKRMIESMLSTRGVTTIKTNECEGVGVDLEEMWGPRKVI